MTTSEPPNTRADTLLQRIDDLEERLAHARTELDTAAQLRTLGLLAGAIAHEFNNILTPVLSYARAALDAPGDSALARKALEKAADGVERASRIAGSVLNLAGRAADAADPITGCSVEDALQGALACMGQPLGARGIELRSTIEPGVVLPIHQTDLEHVLLNLLLNACRALQGGGGVIEVWCGQAGPGPRSTWNEEAPHHAVLEFRDNGPGIDPALLPTVFEPFQRGGDQTDRERRGHGLGLAICRRLVEAAGGSISASAGANAGATFTITLPLARGATNRAA